MTASGRHLRQDPAEVAVVVPTLLHPCLLRAARSVFGQDGPARIHLLIGVDVAAGDPAILDRLRAECPSHVMLTVLDLGYSTSVRHGGVHSNAYGGALRAILTYAANSPRVAYLDDNDWYAPMHLGLLLGAMAGKAWAFSGRWLVDPGTGWPICPDEWDSVGPGRGINAARFGGFVQPSTLMLDKAACRAAVPLWAEAAFADGSGEDRLVFEALRTLPWGESPPATCFCALNARSVTDAHHVAEFDRRGLLWVRDRALVGRIEALLAEAANRLRRGQPAQALAACDAALAIHPRQPAALRRRSEALAALGRHAEAELPRAQAALLEFALDPPP